MEAFVWYYYSEMFVILNLRLKTLQTLIKGRRFLAQSASQMFFETSKNSAFAVKTYCFTINSKKLFYEPAAAGLTSLFSSVIIRRFII